MSAVIPYIAHPVACTSVEEELLGWALSRLEGKIKYEEVQLIGSCYTHDAALAEDVDVLMRVQELTDHWVTLVELGFERGGSMEEGPEGDCWESWKKNQPDRKAINLLLTDDSEFYDKFVVAAEVCRFLRLDTKLKRQAVHQIVMDGFKADNLKHYG